MQLAPQLSQPPQLLVLSVLTTLLAAARQAAQTVVAAEPVLALAIYGIISLLPARLMLN